MMKQLVLVGTLVGALASGGAFAQAPTTAEKPMKPEAKDQAKPAAKRPARHSGTMAMDEKGHVAPKAQPTTAPAPSAPTGDLPLGNVHLAKPVKADGKSLPAGTYVVRLTAQAATPDAKGQTKTLERWVEFVQKGQVKGREVVTIVPQDEIDKVQKDTPPRPNSSKVETLKGGDYVRLWINKGGNHYLVHFPA